MNGGSRNNWCRHRSLNQTQNSRFQPQSNESRKSRGDSKPKPKQKRKRNDKRKKTAKRRGGTEWKIEENKTWRCRGVGGWMEGEITFEQRFRKVRDGERGRERRWEIARLKLYRRIRVFDTAIMKKKRKAKNRSRNGYNIFSHAKFISFFLLNILILFWNFFFPFHARFTNGLWIFSKDEIKKR